MASIKQNSALLALQAHFRQPRQGSTNLRKRSRTLTTFGLAFACLFIFSFSVVQNGYVDALAVTHHARSADFGMVFGVTEQGIYPDIGKLVLWLASTVTGVSASVMLYVLPAMTGAALLTWVYVSISRQSAFSMRALYCCLLFASPAALMLFTTGSELAIKTLLMTGAVSAVAALSDGNQPRHYLTFGALFAALIVVQGNWYVVPLLLLPYLLCEPVRRTRNEWITHLGLVLLPLLFTLAALGYLDWIWQQYMPRMWRNPLSARGSLVNDGFITPFFVGSLVPLLLACCWLAHRANLPLLTSVWTTLSFSYLVTLIALLLLQDKPHAVHDFVAYGFGIIIAALARASIQNSRRVCILWLCSLFAAGGGWCWEEGASMSKSGQWRHAVGISFSSTLDTLTGALPSPVSRSFATALPDQNLTVRDGAVRSMFPNERTSSDPVSASGAVQEYFARYGVQLRGVGSSAVGNANAVDVD
jgi:hypothetical protein